MRAFVHTHGEWKTFVDDLTVCRAVAETRTRIDRVLCAACGTEEVFQMRVHRPPGDREDLLVQMLEDADRNISYVIGRWQDEHLTRCSREVPRGRVIEILGNCVKIHDTPSRES